jgi:hypothetical protein
MKHTYAFLALCLSSTANGQLVNGSFENENGWDLTGWISSCQNAFFGTGHPGDGDWSASVPHGETNGSCYASKLIQLVPSIHDGETWTLGGWCHNMLTGFNDPYIGIGMGIKHEDGWWEYFTSADMNTGNWTHLSVTNSFTMAAGDTAFVILDAGIVSGNGTGAWSEFDGLTLTDLSTGIAGVGATSAPSCFPNPATDKLWVNLPERAVVVELIDALGRTTVLPSFIQSGRTLELDLTGLPSGPALLRIRTLSEVRTLRFIKTPSR